MGRYDRYASMSVASILATTQLHSLRAERQLTQAAGIVSVHVLSAESLLGMAPVPFPA